MTARHMRARSGDTRQLPFIPGEEGGREPTTAATVIGAILVCLCIAFPFVMAMLFGAPEPERVWVEGHWETELPRD